MTTDEISSEPWLMSPHWRLASVEGYLMAQAGADEVFIIDEVRPDEHARLISICEAGHAAAWSQDENLGAAIRQLRRLGLVLPAQALAVMGPRVRLTWLGTSCTAFTESLTNQGWQVCSGDALASLNLLVRTDASWSHVLDTYAAWHEQGPHLLIDLSCHHTLSVGPLVVPGQTACVECLAHRITRRWGDLPPPAQPQVLRHAAGVAALLCASTQLGPALVERVVTMDLRHLRTTQHRVHPMPGCPACEASRQQTHLELAMPFQLPWIRSN